MIESVHLWHAFELDHQGPATRIIAINPNIENPNFSPRLTTTMSPQDVTATPKRCCRNKESDRPQDASACVEIRK